MAEYLILICADESAYAAALTAWTRQGVPDSPGAWLTTAARRRAIDAKRRDREPARRRRTR